MPKNQGAAFVAFVQNTPCQGPLLEVNWLLKAQNPRMPTQFYWVGKQAVLQTSGRVAVLCGQPQSISELESFLQFTGCQQLTTNAWAPAGWHTQQHCQLLWQPGSATKAIPHIPIDTAPPVQAILQLLAGENTLPAALHSNMYADMCTRLNHGYAASYCIWQQGSLASTASAVAITPHQVHIALVYTHATQRKHGYAGALLAALCKAYSGHHITLECKPELVPFYQQYGFTPTGQTATVATPTP
ncbi:GNAT family N-acetyltransferase [Ruminococcaceae bacterium OttesenSCG-928-A16]|nr:GNAT family N-acetyltransferase [Ruminococcaceae bacterium OttesenSCG-928-A16]